MSLNNCFTWWNQLLEAACLHDMIQKSQLGIRRCLWWRECEATFAVRAIWLAERVLWDREMAEVVAMRWIFLNAMAICSRFMVVWLIIVCISCLYRTTGWGYFNVGRRIGSQLEIVVLWHTHVRIIGSDNWVSGIGRQGNNCRVKLWLWVLGLRALDLRAHHLLK